MIELVLVISIILVLMGIVLAVYTAAVRGAKSRVDGAVNTRDRAHIQAILEAQEEEGMP